MTSPLIGKMPYTSNTWRECIIWAQHERGVVEVRADVIGACGVHPGGVEWHVTHIPTGRVVAARDYKTQAWLIAVKLAAVNGLNCESAPKVRRLVAGVIDA